VQFYKTTTAKYRTACRRALSGTGDTTKTISRPTPGERHNAGGPRPQRAHRLVRAPSQPCPARVTGSEPLHAHSRLGSTGTTASPHATDRAKTHFACCNACTSTRHRPKARAHDSHTCCYAGRCGTPPRQDATGPCIPRRPHGPSASASYHPCANRASPVAAVDETTRG